MGPWLAAHFVNPALLGALALVAVPIIIWLLHRFRFKTVEWAAQVFLLRALKRSQRRLRIENLLLLLIRCLVIALFVVALARPRGRPAVLSDPNDARRNIVLLLDTSYSTGYQLGSDASETVHEREKRTAKDLARQLKNVDRIAVVAFDETARLVYPTPRTVDERVKKDLSDDLDNLPELQRGARGTDYAAAFAALPSLLRRFDLTPDGQPPLPGTPPVAKSVFLLTDGQRSGLLDVSGKLRDPNVRSRAEEVKALGATLFILDCGVEEPRNASVTLLETREPIVGTEMPCLVEAGVRNWSSVALKGLTFEFFVDGSETPAKSQPVELAAGETKPIEPLRYVFHESGPHRVVGRLRSDALVVDNERALIVDVREAVKVLLVDGEPKPEKWMSETDFLKRALQPKDVPTPEERDIFKVEVVTEGQLGGRARYRDYDVVVIANVVSLADEQAAALEAFVQGGGAVVFTMGELVNRRDWNERLWRDGKGVFPCKLGDVRGPASTERSGARDPNAPEWMLVLADREHPVLRIFGEEDLRQVLREPSIFRYVSADLGTPPTASAPLRLAPRPRGAPGGAGSARGRPTPEEEQGARDGAPILVEKPFGRGRSVAWLSSIDLDWNNAVAYLSYVVIWRELTLDLARSSKPRRNLLVGDRYERMVTPSEYAPSFEVMHPDGGREVFRTEVVDGREQYRIAYPPYPDAKQVGGGKRPGEGVERPGVFEVRGDGVKDWFAVRVDPAEGDTGKLALEDWKDALAGLDVRVTKPEALSDAFAQPGEGTQSNELWGPLLAAVVALLALESLLAALFGRRRR